MTPDTSVPSQDGEPLYFYADANNDPVGPLSLRKLHHIRSVGVIGDETLIVEDGGSEWRPYATFAVPAQPPPLTPARMEKSPARSPLVVSLVGACLLLLAVIAGLVVFIGSIRSGASSQAKQTRASVPPPLATPPSPSPLPSTPAREIAERKSERKARKAASPPPSPTAKQLAQFEKFRLGNYSYEIKECEAVTRVSGQGQTKEAGPEAVFVVVRYSIQNETNSPEAVLSNDFKIADAKGTTFTHSAEAGSTLLALEEAIFRELQPGVAKDAITAFEIPRATLDDELTLIVPEKGLFSSGKKEVRIKPTLTSSAPIVTATPEPAATDPKTIVERAAKEVFGKGLSETQVIALFADDGRKSGLYNVKVRFLSSLDWSAKTRKWDIENGMRDAYEQLFKLGFVSEVTLFADTQFLDTFGNESVGLAYKTSMTKAVADKINWQNKNALDFTNLWTTQQRHPQFNAK